MEEPVSTETTCHLLEERERSECSIGYAQDLRPGQATEPPPTFPFLDSQCQRAVSGTKFHHARDATPPARRSPAGGVGGVYRRVVFPCQTVKRLKIRNFPGLVDGSGSWGKPCGSLNQWGITATPARIHQWPVWTGETTKLGKWLHNRGSPTQEWALLKVAT